MAKQSLGQRAWYERNKDAQIAKAKEKRKAFALELAEIKRSLGCSMCPETDPVCLDFHHEDHVVKEFEIAKGLCRGYGRARMMTEVAKCSVLCANCHRKKHAGMVLMAACEPSKL